MSAKKRQNVYERVTTAVLAKLEEGTVPWAMPWQDGGGLRPISVSTGKPYSGVNTIALGMQGYGSPYWLTYRQAQSMGAQVRKGERASVALLWRPLDEVRDEDTGEVRKRGGFVARGFNVFNADQVDGLDPEKVPPSPAVGEVTWTPDERATNVVAAYLEAGGPTFAEGGTAAFYRPATDHVQVPDRGRFATADAFHRVTFHELAHSTAAPSRLDRRQGDDKRGTWGDDSYAREELVAELAAAMLCAMTGVSAEVDTSAAYIDHWRTQLGADPKLVVQAASKAQKAADLIVAGVQA